MEASRPLLNWVDPLVCGEFEFPVWILNPILVSRASASGKSADATRIVQLSLQRIPEPPKSAALLRPYVSVNRYGHPVVPVYTKPPMWWGSSRDVKRHITAFDDLGRFYGRLAVQLSRVGQASGLLSGLYAETAEWFHPRNGSHPYRSWGRTRKLVADGLYERAARQEVLAIQPYSGHPEEHHALADVHADLATQRFGTSLGKEHARLSQHHAGKSEGWDQEEMNAVLRMKGYFE